MPSDSINKLSRMFQDIKISNDLNEDLKKHLNNDMMNIKVIRTFKGHLGEHAVANCTTISLSPLPWSNRKFIFRFYLLALGWKELQKFLFNCPMKSKMEFLKLLISTIRFILVENWTSIRFCLTDHSSLNPSWVSLFNKCKNWVGHKLLAIKYNLKANMSSKWLRCKLLF